MSDYPNLIKTMKEADFSRGKPKTFSEAFPDQCREFTMPIYFINDRHKMTIEKHRAARPHPAGLPTWTTPRRPRGQYVASPFGRKPGGYDNGMVTYDEAAFVQPEVFTDYDVTVRRFTVPQAYAHAATVIRARRGLSPSTPVFPRGSYDSNDKVLSLTMQDFSRLVNHLVSR